MHRRSWLWIYICIGIYDGDSTIYLLICDEPDLYQWLVNWNVFLRQELDEKNFITFDHGKTLFVLPDWSYNYWRNWVF